MKEKKKKKEKEKRKNRSCDSNKMLADVSYSCQ
jgi:hypothetical protein